MDGPERVAALMELEAWLADLVAQGWCLESISTQDARDEPFKVEIVLTCDGVEPEGGVL